MFVRLDCQRDIPVQIVRYHVKPLSLPGFDYGMRLEAFNGKAPALSRTRKSADS